MFENFSASLKRFRSDNSHVWTRRFKILAVCYFAFIFIWYVVYPLLITRQCDGPELGFAESRREIDTAPFVFSGKLISANKPYNTEDFTRAWFQIERIYKLDGDLSGLQNLPHVGLGLADDMTQLQMFKDFDELASKKDPYTDFKKLRSRTYFFVAFPNGSGSGEQYSLACFHFSFLYRVWMQLWPSTWHTVDGYMEGVCEKKGLQWTTRTVGVPHGMDGITSTIHECVHFGGLDLSDDERPPLK